ncbi:hypothetical protein ACFFGH_10795 [Lysobacter korlensis]|uniref:Uncharacterized protein n=1 Tax=Lysobacter korlensis TaxID=553636 RepID=A0ABV6RPK0_9GAMM
MTTCIYQDFAEDELADSDGEVWLNELADVADAGHVEMTAAEQARVDRIAERIHDWVVEQL